MRRRATALALAALAAAVTARAADDPPRVAAAHPDIGDAVDASLAEVRVTFDRPMHRGSFSFVGGGADFPKLTAPPRWVDDRTCVMPVALEPGRRYRLQLNSGVALGFRAATGAALTPYPLVFDTLEADADPPRLDPADARAGFETLRALIDRRYSYRDRTGVDWAARLDAHREAIEAADTPAALARAVRDALAPARDLHLWLDVRGIAIPTHLEAVTPNRDPAATAEQVQGLRRHGPVAVGRVADGPAYVAIDTWDASLTEHLGAVHAAIDAADPDAGLILDVRVNTGGSEPLARAVAGRFVTEPVTYARQRWRSPGHRDGWGPVQTRVLVPDKQRPAYTGRVAVLVGPAVMSSNEAFVLMMRQAPRATLIGETTRGSSGNPRPHPLADGVTLYLPAWQAMQADGTPFESEGLAPDLTVRWRPTVVDPDPVLRAAVRHLAGDDAGASD